MHLLTPYYKNTFRNLFLVAVSPEQNSLQKNNPLTYPRDKSRPGSREDDTTINKISWHVFYAPATGFMSIGWHQNHRSKQHC